MHCLLAAEDLEAPHGPQGVYMPRRSKASSALGPDQSLRPRKCALLPLVFASVARCVERWRSLPTLRARPPILGAITDSSSHCSVVALSAPELAVARLRSGPGRKAERRRTRQGGAFPGDAPRANGCAFARSKAIPRRPPQKLESLQAQEQYRVVERTVAPSPQNDVTHMPKVSGCLGA